MQILLEYLRRHLCFRGLARRIPIPAEESPSDQAGSDVCTSVPGIRAAELLLLENIYKEIEPFSEYLFAT